MSDVTVLANAAALGPRFAAVLGRPAGWTRATDLFGGQLAEHVRRVGDGSGATDAVAGTLLLQQYAGILVAPVLAALYTEGRVLDCSMATVSVHLREGRPERLAFASPSSPADDLRGAAATLGPLLVGEHLDVAVDRVRDVTRAGRRVLRGAVASAVATALLHLSWRHADHAHHLADAADLLRVAGLSDLVELAAVEVAGERWMFAGRRTCCLAFRSARNRERPDPYCANCPVLPAAQVRASFTEAAATYHLRHGGTATT